MTIGELAFQFNESVKYWGREEDEVNEAARVAFEGFISELPFDVFLTNPIWEEAEHD